MILYNTIVKVGAYGTPISPFNTFTRIDDKNYVFTTKGLTETNSIEGRYHLPMQLLYAVKEEFMKQINSSYNQLT